MVQMDERSHIRARGHVTLAQLSVNHVSDKNGGQRTDVGRNGIRGREVLVGAKAPGSSSGGPSLGS